MMRRSMMALTILTLAFGLTMALPAGATARPLVSNVYERLDEKIESAWFSGLLTRAEKNTLLWMQERTDRMIRDARRDGRITGGERARVRRAADETVDAFYRYRDNRAVRFASVLVPTVHPFHHGSHHVAVDWDIHVDGTSHRRGHGHSPASDRERDRDRDHDGDGDPSHSRSRSR